MFARLWSLLRLVFVWKISDVKQDETTDTPPDCIIMLAFGQAYERIGLGAGLETSRLVPGEPNEAIARLLGSDNPRHRYLERPQKPILAQWEFAETREFQHTFPYDKMQIDMELGSRDEYRNTYEVLQEAKAYMDSKGWTKAVIMAHPWHLARAASGQLRRSASQSFTIK